MRTIQQAAANLSASVGQIPVRYKQGVEGADWATNAGSDASESLYASQTAKAAAEKRRQTAIRAVGNEVWKKAAVDSGAPIIGQRIQASLGKYQTNFAPVLSAMNSAAASLKPKTGDLMTDIMNRVAPVAEAAQKAAGKK